MSPVKSAAAAGGVALFSLTNVAFVAVLIAVGVGSWYGTKALAKLLDKRGGKFLREVKDEAERLRKEETKADVVEMEAVNAQGKVYHAR